MEYFFQFSLLHCSHHSFWCCEVSDLPLGCTCLTHPSPSVSTCLLSATRWSRLILYLTSCPDLNFSQEPRFFSLRETLETRLEGPGICIVSGPLSVRNYSKQLGIRVKDESELPPQVSSPFPVQFLSCSDNLSSKPIYLGKRLIKTLIS